MTQTRVVTDEQGNATVFQRCAGDMQTAAVRLEVERLVAAAGADAVGKAQELERRVGGEAVPENLSDPGVFVFGSDACGAYLILPSRNSTCLRTIGSYFRSSSRFLVLLRFF